jgi:hypothetical protein
VDVGVGDGVSVGGIGVFVEVGEGVSVFLSVTGAVGITPGIKVAVKGSVIMMGVAVTMMGVLEGITVQAGNGCSGALKVSHAERIKIKTSKAENFFMFLLLRSAKWVFD